MKKIDKKELDELIRLERKYWKTGDVDILPALNQQANKMETMTGFRLSGWENIIDGILKLNINMPYETIYKVFQELGFTINIGELEND